VPQGVEGGRRLEPRRRAGVRDRAELAAAGTVVVAADGTSALHQTRDCPGREGEALQAAPVLAAALA
jgi:hypothetical protein